MEACLNAPAQKHLFTKRYRRVKAPEASEQPIHETIVKYLRLMARPDVQWWHVPNGGARERVPMRKADGTVKWWCPSGKTMKKLGAVPGAPDLMFRWRARWSLDCLQETLDMEIKSPSGEQTKEQEEWQRMTVATGGHYYVVRSLNEAIAVFEKHGITKQRAKVV